MTLDELIPLSELIEHLRSQLLDAAWKGYGQEPRFQVVETELELEVVATKDFGREAGVKLWILSGKAKKSKEFASTQKIRMKMIPVDKSGNPITVSSGERREPSGSTPE